MRAQELVVGMVDHRPPQPWFGELTGSRGPVVGSRVMLGVDARTLAQWRRWMSGSLNASTGAARPEGATAAAADVPPAADGPELPVRSSGDARREGVAPVCRLRLTAALSGRGGGLATRSGRLLSCRRSVTGTRLSRRHRGGLHGVLAGREAARVASALGAGRPRVVARGVGTTVGAILGQGPAGVSTVGRDPRRYAGPPMVGVPRPQTAWPRPIRLPSLSRNQAARSPRPPLLG